MRLFLSTLLILLLIACSGNENSSVDSDKKYNELGELVERVHHCSKLEVAEYTMLKIVSFNDSSILNIAGHKIPIPGERKLMIPIEVKMKVFVDLNYVIKDDITVDSSRINITLPSPKLEIYSTKIDHEWERESVSWFRSKITEQERERFIQQGIEDVKENIPSIEINNLAKRNTEKTLQPIISNIGMKQHLTVDFKESGLFSPALKD